MNARELTVAICLLLALSTLSACNEGGEEEPAPDTNAGDMNVKEENAADSGLHHTISAGEDLPRWHISPYGETSTITAATDVEDLRRIWGTEAVQSPVNILQEEGETLPGAILFPDEPERRLEIVWNNPEEEASPFRIILKGSHSRWQLPAGIGLGIGMDSLIELNGKPISFLGFGWDNAGMVMDWNEGELQEMEDPHGSVKVFLEPDARAYEMLQPAMRSQVSGDQIVISDHPACPMVRPTVGKIIVEFRGTRNEDFN